MLLLQYQEIPLGHLWGELLNAASAMSATPPPPPPSIVSWNTICRKKNPGKMYEWLLLLQCLEIPQHCLREYHLPALSPGTPSAGKKQGEMCERLLLLQSQELPQPFSWDTHRCRAFPAILHQCLKQTTACTLNWNWNWRKTICTRKTREVCVNKGNVWLTAAASEMSQATPALFARLPSAWGKWSKTRE